MISRRRILPFAAIPALSGLARSQEGGIEEFDFSRLQGLLVPNGEFFVRNHFAVPRLVRSAWTLTVTGGVRSPLKVGWSDLMRMPSRTMVATLECAGNKVGGGGVGTAEWEGVPLRELLERAGILPSVRHIRLVGADRGTIAASEHAIPYARSIPLDKALDPDTLIAFRMNQAPLPAALGFPARALVPGWYAMDSVKWLIRIEALAEQDRGFFMAQRYQAVHAAPIGSKRVPVRAVRVKSQIASPRDGELLSDPFNVRGAAWGGDGGLAKVEVSLDGGARWQEAVLNAHEHPYAWVLWSLQLAAGSDKEPVLMARATDRRGNTQSLHRDPQRLDAYELNWIHSVRCRR